MFWTTALERGEGSALRPGHFLPPGKTRYPFYRRLGGNQSRSGQWKISPHRDSIPGPSRPYSVAIPTELSRPTVLIQVYKNKQTHKTQQTLCSMCGVTRLHLLVIVNGTDHVIIKLMRPKSNDWTEAAIFFIGTAALGGPWPPH